MNRKLYLIITLMMLLTSCSQLPVSFWSNNASSRRLDSFVADDAHDYKDHLAALGSSYINSRHVKIIRLNRRDKRYLRYIYNRIIKNNERLLTSTKMDTKFYVIRDKSPFIFSLPGNQFFFSSGLINKYIKNEEVFVSALTFEIIKSQRSIYRRGMIVPIGYIYTEKLLSLIRIPIEAKSEINRWAFYSMKRAGFDPSAFLAWLQTLNKNALDFTLLLGNSKTILKEEFVFKNFLVKESLKGNPEDKAGRSSSREFYKFIKAVKRRSNI